MKDPIVVAGRRIGLSQPPFIIAEMSGNHNGSLSRALKIVDAAARAGVDALKIQTYTADTMTLNMKHGEFFIRNPKSLWKGSSLYDLYRRAHTPWKWHKAIFDRCRRNGIIGFSTPFDSTAVDYLEKLNVPLYKVASFENTDLPLIRKVAKTGKPMIVSTGMATVAEIDELVRAARDGGCKNLILLKCTSSYPANPADSHLSTIPHMRRLFDVQVGLSDHTLGVGVAVAGISLGATVIEKHFTLDRSDGGVDSAFSMEPAEMRVLVEEGRKAREALGFVRYGPTEKEKDSLIFRRSLYVTKEMKIGDRFAPQNLRAVRPGKGLSAKYYDLILGKKVNRRVKPGTPVSWELIG